jgi:hypothetical protein
MKQKYVVLFVLLFGITLNSCQVVYFVLPQKYESQLKTRKKQKQAEKLQQERIEREEERKEKLRKQWLDIQSSATRKQMEELEEQAEKINKKRRRQKFFLWRWLGI